MMYDISDMLVLFFSKYFKTHRELAHFCLLAILGISGNNYFSSHKVSCSGIQCLLGLKHGVVVHFKYYEYSLRENTNDYTDSEGLAAPHYELLPTDSKLIKAKKHEQ